MITVYFKLFTEPPTIVDQKGGDTEEVQVQAGDLVRMTCRTTGRPTPDVVWLREGRPVVGGEMDSYSLTLRHVSVAQSGRYLCQVTNRAGSANFTYAIVVRGRLVYITHAVNQSYSEIADSRGLDLHLETGLSRLLYCFIRTV